jgi:LPXTG-site transpeptidase (sortase) family protein
VKINYRKANNWLLAAIVVINLYVLLAPLWPRVSFWWATRNGDKQNQLVEKIHTPTPEPLNAPKPAKKEPNQLIIPSIVLDEKTHEGPASIAYANLRKGVWRWPDSSTPNKGGNTVFLGHVFTYTDPQGVFYRLNKVKLGDQIGVIWDNVHYLYKVTNIKVVPPSDVSIQNPTKDARLTIFTCTPLWNPTHRLVVTAERIAYGQAVGLTGENQ